MSRKRGSGSVLRLSAGIQRLDGLLEILALPAAAVWRKGMEEREEENGTEQDDEIRVHHKSPVVTLNSTAHASLLADMRLYCVVGHYGDEL